MEGHAETRFERYLELAGKRIVIKASGHAVELEEQLKSCRQRLKLGEQVSPVVVTRGRRRHGMLCGRIAGCRMIGRKTTAGKCAAKFFGRAAEFRGGAAHEEKRPPPNNNDTTDPPKGKGKGLEHEEPTWLVGQHNIFLEVVVVVLAQTWMQTYEAQFLWKEIRERTRKVNQKQVQVWKWLRREQGDV